MFYKRFVNLICVSNNFLALAINYGQMENAARRGWDPAQTWHGHLPKHQCRDAASLAKKTSQLQGCSQGYT